MATQCPKCNYVRTPEDWVPDYECPKCGIIYTKYRAGRTTADRQTSRKKPNQTAINWTRWRIVGLVMILLVVAELNYQSVVTWQQPLVVAIHPIKADASPGTAQFVDSIRPGSFLQLEDFFADSAEMYELHLQQPIKLYLEKLPTTYPPLPPANPNMLNVVFWSLRMRLWALFVDYDSGLEPDIQLFLLYHDPQINNRVPHSFGLQKGKIAVAHLFAAANMAPSNMVVVAHELLHTLGATDKYDPATNIPIYPDGYGDPGKTPLYPQNLGEIMGGRIVITEASAQIPETLRQVVMGELTAREINWLE